MRMRKTLLGLLIPAAAIAVAAPISAETGKNFSTSIISTYTVNASGTTDVDIRVTLTNQSENLYPKEYSLLLAAGEVENIKARDSEGNILKDYRRQGS